MDSSILLESGSRVLLATVSGSTTSVVELESVLFNKIKWTDDCNAAVCLACQNKFTQIRRKHHCRSCGRVFCSKCCNEKIPLPHIGLLQADRVCSLCKPVLTVFGKAYSPGLESKAQAAVELNIFIQKGTHMTEVLELGGLQIIVWLSKFCDSIQMASHVMAALHNLSTQISLQKFLLEAGCVKAVTSIVQKYGANEKIVTDAISAIMLLCNQSINISKVVNDGGLTALQNFLNSSNQLIKLLAMQALAKMSVCPQSYDIIMRDIGTLRNLLLLAATADAQVSSMSLAILAQISAVQHNHRVTMVQEDAQDIHCLTKILSREDNSIDAMSNYSCLIANLSSQPEVQNILSSLITRIAHLAEQTHQPYHTHLMRALANFSEFPQHTSILVSHIGSVTKVFNSRETAKELQLQALRFIFNVLSHAPDDTTESLAKSDLTGFLKAVGKTKEVYSSVHAALLNISSQVCSP